MSNKKIMVAGFVCVDMTPIMDSEHMSSRKIRDLFAPGKIIPLESVNIGCGGDVSNTGLALKVLGADAVLCGAIGHDMFGHVIKKTFAEYGADKNLLVRDDLTTGFTIALVPPEEDRFFMVCAGANDTFTTDYLDMELVKQCRIFHFGYPTIMKSMYTDNCNRLIDMYRQIHDMGVVTSMDTAMTNPGSEAMHVDWTSVLKRLLPYLDIFTPSVEELCMMVDPDKYKEWLKRADGADMCTVLSIEDDILPLADRMIELGAGIVLLKCGLPGILLRTAGHSRISRIPGFGTEWENLKIFEKSFKADKVLSGVGAGDTSIAAFLTSLVDGKEPKECLELAAATGANCVTSYDAVGGLKPLDECMKRIKSGWKKYDE